MIYVSLLFLLGEYFADWVIGLLQIVHGSSNNGRSCTTPKEGIDFVGPRVLEWVQTNDEKWQRVGFISIHLLYEIYVNAMTYTTATDEKFVKRINLRLKMSSTPYSHTKKQSQRQLALPTLCRLQLWIRTLGRWRPRRSLKHFTPQKNKKEHLPDVHAPRALVGTA
jgi:hypothetical protein